METRESIGRQPEMLQAKRESYKLRTECRYAHCHFCLLLFLVCDARPCVCDMRASADYTHRYRHRPMLFGPSLWMCACVQRRVRSRRCGNACVCVPLRRTRCAGKSCVSLANWKINSVICVCWSASVEAVIDTLYAVSRNYFKSNWMSFVLTESWLMLSIQGQWPL